MKQLADLREGAHFRCPWSGATGTLLLVNACRARVRLDTESVREFAAGNGDVVRIATKPIADWSSATEVEEING